MGGLNSMASWHHRGQGARALKVAVTAIVALLLLSCGPQSIDKKDYRYVDPSALLSLVKDKNAVVVDTMSYLECMDHRIPGSRCIALEEFEGKSALYLPDKKRPIVLYCESEKCPRAGWTYEKAKRLGYEDLYILEGGLAAWKRAGSEIETVERVKRAPVVSIKSDKLDALMKQKKHLFVLDIRPEDAFQAGHIDGAVNIPLHLLHRRIGEVPKDLPVIVVDENGKRSFLACCYLVNSGVKDVTRLFGGMESMAPSSRRKG
jgi:hydroxyacylglutathione hydrolase